jgi:riboflavin kinase/FMN adenylyltransferase
VKHGRKRARRLGFPTANITVADPTLQSGVYSCAASFDGQAHKSMCYYSGRPYSTLEVHIFGVKPYLYGKEISVTLHKFIRPSRPFISMDDLKKRTTKDALDCLRD